MSSNRTMLDVDAPTAARTMAHESVSVPPASARRALGHVRCHGRLLLAAALFLVGLYALHSPTLDQAAAAIDHVGHVEQPSDESQYSTAHPSDAEWLLHALAVCAALLGLRACGWLSNRNAVSTGHSPDADRARLWRHASTRVLGAPPDPLALFGVLRR